MIGSLSVGSVRVFLRTMMGCDRMAAGARSLPVRPTEAYVIPRTGILDMSMRLAEMYMRAIGYRDETMTKITAVAMCSLLPLTTRESALMVRRL